MVDLFTEVFGSEDIVTAPELINFDPIQANEFTVFKKEKVKDSCLKEVDYLLENVDNKERHQ